MRKSKDMPYHIGLRVKIYLSYQQKHIIAVNGGVRCSVHKSNNLQELWNAGASAQTGAIMFLV